MVLITFGLWLLVIPFYPIRCTTCGGIRSDGVPLPSDPAAGRRGPLGGLTPWEIIGIVVVLLAVLAVIFGKILYSSDAGKPPVQSQAETLGWVDQYEAPSAQAVAQVLSGNYETKDAADLRRIEAALQDMENEYVARPNDTYSKARHDRREFLEGLHSKLVTLSPTGERGIIVTPELAEYEGSGGGDFYLLSENGSKLVSTFGQRLSVASHLTNGRYDLVLDTGSVAEPAQSKWKWDGVQYREGTSVRANSSLPSAVTNSDSPEDHELHISPNLFGNPLSDGRTYSVALIAASANAGHVPPRSQIFAQGKLAGFGYGAAAYIQDEQRHDESLLCSMTEEEFADVKYLYHIGEPVQVFGEYSGVFNHQPIFRNCRVASPTGNVVRPAQVPEMSRPAPSDDGSVNSPAKDTAIPAADDRSVSSLATKTDALTGTYSGKVHNTKAQLWAAFETAIQERKGNILSGCMFVHRPLYGSGKLSGDARTSKVTFDVPSSVGVIRFTGNREGNDISGAYYVVRAGEVESYGEFELHRQGELPTDFDTHDCPDDSAVH
jgi:hypothetical protein